MSRLARRSVAVLREAGARGLVLRASAFVERRARLRIATTLLRRKARRASLEEATELGFDFKALGVSIKPIQVPEELAGFLEHVATLRPERVLEIGAAGGGTLFLLARVAAADALLLSVELPEPGQRGVRMSRELPYRLLGCRGQHVRLLRADSQTLEARAVVEQHFSGLPLDLLFIDGDHSAAGVRRDFELYAPLVRDGGLIAFHDIVPGPERFVGGVPAFWEELAHDHDTEALVKSWEQGGYGIGLLRVHRE